MSGRGLSLRERRLALGLSQEALAEAAGVSARSINRWEQGRATPQMAARRRLAAALDVQPSDLAPTSSTDTLPSITSSDVPAAWYVPPRRNPFFIARATLLERVHASLRQTGPDPRIVALTGLGGIGKTQAALEYAYRYANAYGAVFWLAADSASACLASFGELATILDLPVRSDPNFVRTLAGVRRWFRQHSDWLVILDNLEEVRVLDELSIAGSGAVLLTTRARAVGAVHTSFDLSPLSTDDGALLLLRRGRIIALEDDLDQASEEDRAAARELATSLGGLPLAIDQAGGYLEETTCGLDVYLQRYETQQHTLLARRGRVVLDHPESVAATLGLAYHRISSLNPAAGELLSLCAFLHPDSIPEELVNGIASDPLRLDEAIADLTTLSVVRRDRRSNALTMHRLVQDVVRFELEPDQQQRWATRAVSAVARALPGSQLYHFSAYARWVPHALAAVDLISAWSIGTPDAARLLDRVGAYSQVTGQYATSQRLLWRALRLRKEVLGRDHPEIAETHLHLAELALVLGHYARADVLAQAALVQLRGRLGSADLRVAHASGLLARVNLERGRYTRAEPLLRDALDVQVEQLGEQDPQVADTLGQLAELAFMRGRYLETEQLLRRVLAINEVALGPEHLVTGLTLDALGTLYRYAGREADALQEFRRALPILSASLGDDHPAVLTVLNGVARAKLAVGDPGEAEALARLALDARESTLGPDHPKLAYSLQALSEILLAKGELAEAEALARRGLAIRQRVHADRHPTVSISLDILAQIRQRKGDMQEAEKLYCRALAVLEDTVGSTHPRFVETLGRYASLMDELQHQPEADAARARAAAIASQLSKSAS